MTWNQTASLRSLADDLLEQWASQRLAVDSEAISGAPWRGNAGWGRNYGQVLLDWQREGYEGRPAAFRDGVARPEQLLPGTPGAHGAVWAHTVPKGARDISVGDAVESDDWTFWLLRCGRGFGKTRVGAECVIEWARAGISPILIAGATSYDVRASMVEGPGESAIMKICPRDFLPDYEPSKRKLTFPNGVECQLLSAEEPERFRGVQFVKAWLDELAAWKLLAECWSQIRYVMRVKRRHVKIQLVITTTPRAKKVIRDLSRDPRCALTVRPSYDNRSNLASEFVDLIATDEGTRLGQQEIHGAILEDIEGALWTEERLDRSRYSQHELDDILADLRTDLELQVQRPASAWLPSSNGNGSSRVGWGKLVAAVDPPGGRTECGIVVGGRLNGCPWKYPGCQGHLFILADRTVGERPTPDQWAPAVAGAYHEWSCNEVVAEINYGGDMVKHTIGTEDSGIPIRVVTATRGKRARAEPIANLWSGDHPRAHLVGRFPEMEQELTTWVPDSNMESPNRMDAMVWVATHLMLNRKSALAGPTGTEKTSTWRRG